MRSSLDYAGLAQLCTRSPIVRKIMRAHNHIIQRSLGTSHGPVSVCLTVRPSVTSRCSTKMAKCRITQTTPHDSPGI